MSYCLTQTVNVEDWAKGSFVGMLHLQITESSKYTLRKLQQVFVRIFLKRLARGFSYIKWLVVADFYFLRSPAEIICS